MYYLDKDNEPHFSPPASVVAALIADGGQEVTEAVFLARQVEMNTPTAGEQALLDIEALEAQVTPRRMREAFAGNADALAFIQDIESQIAALRAQL